jgi:hypothetical protein
LPHDVNGRFLGAVGPPETDVALMVRLIEWRITPKRLVIVGKAPYEPTHETEALNKFERPPKVRA